MSYNIMDYKLGSWESLMKKHALPMYHIVHIIVMIDIKYLNINSIILYIDLDLLLIFDIMNMMWMILSLIVISVHGRLDTCSISSPYPVQRPGSIAWSRIRRITNLTEEALGGNPVQGPDLSPPGLYWSNIVMSNKKRWILDFEFENWK